MTEFAVQTRNLTKYYGKQQVLNNVSLSIPKGSIFGIVGPNGAGKTTLLKILCGITKPNSGDVFVFGEKLNQKNIKKIGALIESPAIYGNLTASENLLLHALLSGLGAREINRALEIVGLDTGKKVASKFSLGMKQRLGIAIALLGDPEILVLDEPTNGLDPIGVQEMRELIISLKESGKTVIVTSHILSEVEKIIDKLVIIHKGTIKYDGDFDRNQDLEKLFTSIIRGF
ncbi:ABC-2 type transport system ATP-binding protein [Fervidobacterium changbaicum]|uniref:Lantibiotic ABC transporter ATP-binding protein n=1 Tax=Fervidobacterium changbaicum TaxID=310769 RepID=A0ABX5QS75_9BACT|nr:ATP-binding cassette domain-containing protein [Fervidobacterium changbaicum]QAV33351.1 lantibiotic ABC transporter ATP-binding protein [Fervidobacterium changbaicum]SDG89434.1 ABC-2 type transport system ATP-binding protein [Fervidobacterium changbaicum]